MTTEMILAHMIGIMAAGTDTTANLLGSAVRRLTEHPDVRDVALADPTLWPAVVEEALRRESPADKTYWSATRDVEVRGEMIPKGSAVILSFSGANGDAERFPDPLAFDIDRPDITGSVALGVGRDFLPRRAARASRGADRARTALHAARWSGRRPGRAAALRSPPGHADARGAARYVGTLDMAVSAPASTVRGQRSVECLSGAQQCL